MSGLTPDGVCGKIVCASGESLFPLFARPAHSSSGLGHRPLKAKITGSNPVCATSAAPPECTIRRHRVFPGFPPMDEQSKQDYRAAFDAWLEQLRRVHAVLLDGEPMDPLHRIALLRRESHLKERYEEARARFLGLPTDDDAGGAFPPE
jgi:hypothetical protein